MGQGCWFSSLSMGVGDAFLFTADFESSVSLIGRRRRERWANFKFGDKEKNISLPYYDPSSNEARQKCKLHYGTYIMELASAIGL